MQRYTYSHPNSITTTPLLTLMNAEGEPVLTCQKYYSNRMKHLANRLFDSQYFLAYQIYNLKGQPFFCCKRIARRGKVYFEAKDLVANKKYRVAYDGWQQLIPDLIISDDQLTMTLHKEMEDWSTFAVDDQVVARWKATLVDDEFQIELEIEEISLILHPGFFMAISQCVLFIGG